MSGRDVLFRQERVLEVVRKFVHGERDYDGAPVTVETLVAAQTSYEAAQAAEER